MDEVLQWKHKCTAVLTCNKGRGTEIYFDPNNKSSSGKMIPMEIATRKKKNRIFIHNPFILISDVRIVDISIKQTMALYAIVIVAVLTISAVPSPRPYAVSAQNNWCT